jgi:hypothetical protein
MRATVNDDDAGADLPHEYGDQCMCRTCKRRRGMLGIPHPQPLPPQPPVTGRFMAPAHPHHDGRDTKERFIDELTRQVHEQR